MAIREIKDFGHSVKMRLLKVARNEGQRYQLLLTRYLQERLLYRLSISEYREHLILKGGALLYAYERFNARPTLDIDFMGNRINNDKETIVRAFSRISEIDFPKDGLNFVRTQSAHLISLWTKSTLESVLHLQQLSTA